MIELSTSSHLRLQALAALLPPSMKRPAEHSQDTDAVCTGPGRLDPHHVAAEPSVHHDRSTACHSPPSRP